MTTMRKLPTLRELFDLACENAARVFKADGSIVPIWHAVPTDPDADHLLICTPWENDDEKDTSLDAIRDIFKKHNILRFVLVVEAWTVQMRDPGAFEARPSQHPDRREVIRISAEDRDGSVLSGQYYILRPEHGPVTLSRFHEDPVNGVLVGRMMGLLNETRH